MICIGIRCRIEEEALHGWGSRESPPVPPLYTLSVRPAVFFLSFSLLSGVDAGVCVCRGSAHFESLTFFFLFFTGKNSIVRPSSFTFFLFYLSYYFSRFILFSIPPPHFSALAIVWVGFPVGTPWYTYKMHPFGTISFPFSIWLDYTGAAERGAFMHMTN